MAILAAVVESGAIRRAARELGVTPSAVSQQIRRLELEVGTTLLRRSTRRLALTEAGDAFYRGCASMVAAAREAHERLVGGRGNPHRRAEPGCPGRLRGSAPGARPGAAAGESPRAQGPSGGQRREDRRPAGAARPGDHDRPVPAQLQPGASSPGGLGPRACTRRHPTWRDAELRRSRGPSSVTTSSPCRAGTTAATCWWGPMGGATGSWPFRA